MPELLLELFSEEIPARMQPRAAEDLRRLVTDGLVAAGLTYEGAKAFATPRRLALTVHGVTARSADIREERKGPRVGAPAQALEGFLRAAGLASIEAAQVQSDPKKGDFYVAVTAKPGRPAEEIVAELVPQVVASFPWPKSMRWGARSAPAGSPFAGPEAEGGASLRWVRPLRSILCTFGPETEEPSVVPIEVGGVAAGNVTFGHRFLAGDAPIRVRRFDDYVPALERAKVVLDPERRAAIIETEAQNLAFAQGLEPVADPGLLAEVAGLVEWPVVLMGRFDPAFLDIPEEVIRLTIRQNQKCFVLRDPATGRLANRFLLTANTEASDGGAAIVAGNERVIAARLADARFFWEQDKATPLEDWAAKLASVTFHEKLGSQAERVERIARLARELAPAVAADPDDAERAARLAKADLTTGMVGEFPELQGVMGRYYALAQFGLLDETAATPNLPLEGRSRAAGPLREGVNAEGVRTSANASAEPPLSARPGEPGRLDLPLAGGDGSPPDERRLRAVADAIRDHYKPQGPNDSVPTEPVAVAVALADKLDTLVGFWAIDEKPTGSKDPFALRRAALGVIRILLASEARVLLWRTVLFVLLPFTRKTVIGEALAERAVFEAVRDRLGDEVSSGTWNTYALQKGELVRAREVEKARVLADDLLAFFADRLKVHLRETGARHDLIDAVFAAGTFPPPVPSPARGEGSAAGSASVPSSPPRGEADSPLSPSKGRAGEGAARSQPADSAPSPASDLRSESPSPQRGEERAGAFGSKSHTPGNDDLLLIVRRVEALGQFLDTEDGANLLTGYRRAANILRAEEKTDGAGAFDAPPDADLIAERGLPEERALFAAMQAAEAEAGAAVAHEDFSAAMGALARLRPAVDAFFDKVTVNVEDRGMRANRLRLLNMLRQATRAVADFSRIGG